MPLLKSSKAEVVAQPDIKVLFIEAGSRHADAIRDGLKSYGQVAFGIVSVKTAAEALRAIRDRDIEVAVMDATDESGTGEKIFRELQAADFPVPVLAVVRDDASELPEMGVGDHITVQSIRTAELPKSLVKLWIRSRDKIDASRVDEEEPSEARELVEHQREIVDRFQRVEATFKALMPEGGRTYGQLSQEEQLHLRLNLVDVYIDITKIYFARADEESEDLIRKFSEQLVRLRYPPRELTAIHMAALELMLTEPGQPHRQGLISQNRLVFIDILLNLLGLYYSLILESESGESA
jgi:DNA-binding response OmpR family regulator